MSWKFLIPLTLTLTLTTPVFAQSATDSAAPLRDSVKQKVAEELSQIKKAVSKKAFLGTITSKAEASLTLTSLSNQTRKVIAGTDSVIKLKSGKDGTIADLATGDYVLAMGDVDSAGAMTSKRLLVVGKPAEFKRKAILGTVAKVTTSSLTVDNWTVKLTSATKYTAKSKASDIKANQKIVVLGTVTGDTALTALIIHLVPASPSPTP